ncbi:PucR family transcriptional regulator [Arthrobacter sp. 24S4-2]|nr:PucR family transcriptional regulator [Arthrobacter sp. 24S4-2]
MTAFPLRACVTVQRRSGTPYHHGHSDEFRGFVLAATTRQCIGRYRECAPRGRESCPAHTGGRRAVGGIGNCQPRRKNWSCPHRRSFEETIHAYLSCGCNAIEAAKSLDVHVNTVRYRLSRVEAALFGIDLDDPETRLLVWLQLQARHNQKLDPLLPMRGTHAGRPENRGRAIAPRHGQGHAPCALSGTVPDGGTAGPAPRRLDRVVRETAGRTGQPHLTHAQLSGAVPACPL